MALATTLAPDRSTGLALHLRGEPIPVVLPKLSDPRLHVAATLLTVHVLGQVVVEWDLSIAQILLSLGTCALLEVLLVFREKRAIVWPASAMLTGNGIALILRIPGTEHGDWWSLNGWNVFVGCAALSLASKYVIRVDGRQLFNPSNLGLVLCFFLLGITRVEPQDFWWGPFGVGLALIYLVLLAGGTMITRRLDLQLLGIAFWVTYASILAVVAASGHAMTARYHLGPITGGEYWTIVALSPEVLIFLFFMITDPRTVPAGRASRVVFGVIVGVTSGLFAATQTTEFWTKVLLLTGLVVACCFRPVLERNEDRLMAMARGARRHPVRGLGAVGMAGLVLIGVTWVAGTPARGTLGDGFDSTLRAPVVDAEALPLPTITVPAETTGADGSINAATAPQMARDLLADLIIEAEAIRTGDADLAASATTAERLAETRSAIDSGGGTVVSYDFDTFEVILHRNLAATQAAPRVGIVARGTMTVEQSDDPATPPGTVTDYEGIFLLEDVRNYWLLAGTAPLSDAG